MNAPTPQVILEDRDRRTRCFKSPAFGGAAVHMPAGFELYRLTELHDERTRSITAENPDGAVGGGGQAASDLGTGRKGRPNVMLESGETTTLADIDGSGVIRHIWLTVSGGGATDDHVLRNLVLRAYWDNEDTPSIEVPLGDFFCSGHGKFATVDSVPIVVAPKGGFNCYFPMPFHDGANLTIESEHGEDVMCFYQIDYNEKPVDSEIATFHAQWRRTNPTELGEDHVLLDDVRGEGQYVGTYLAWTALGDHWWGEGEMKFYLDGDDEYPTLCGTGAEDYVGGAWCFLPTSAESLADQETYSTSFLGFPFYDNDGAHPPYYGLYRWHIPDPIRFREDLRVTIQAIGNNANGLFERSDDIASVAYWYQREPHAKFPDLPERRSRRPR